jgi:hypothetical protein
MVCKLRAFYKYDIILLDFVHGVTYQVLKQYVSNATLFPSSGKKDQKIWDILDQAILSYCVKTDRCFLSEDRSKVFFRSTVFIFK